MTREEIERLAGVYYDANKQFESMSIMNTPSGKEERKKAFIEISIASEKKSQAYQNLQNAFMEFRRENGEL